MALKRHYLTRNKKLLPLRNCVSAISVQVKKEPSYQKKQTFRKALLKRKSATV